jgi:hypothetical protein
MRKCRFQHRGQCGRHTPCGLLGSIPHMRCQRAKSEGCFSSVWAEGPSVRSAQGIALGNRTTKGVLRANGPTVRRENCWPVGPLAASLRPVPQGVALGWGNRCPVGAATAPRNRWNKNGTHNSDRGAGCFSCRPIAPWVVSIGTMNSSSWHASLFPGRTHRQGMRKCYTPPESMSFRAASPGIWCFVRGARFILGRERVESKPYRWTSLLGVRQELNGYVEFPIRQTRSVS